MGLITARAMGCQLVQRNLAGNRALNEVLSMGSTLQWKLERRRTDTLPPLLEVFPVH